MPDMRRVTITDVAAQAGVGVGTVSRVLNDEPHVRDATRRAVLEVIEQLGYRPSHVAAALARGSPRTVAILVPYLTRPSVVTRLAGALAVFDARGYDTVICNIETPQQRDRRLDSLLARHRADGVLIVSLPLARRYVAAFLRARLPLATVDVMAAGVPQTVIDDVRGGRLATEHLTSLGHRRVGFIGDIATGPAGTSSLGFTSSKRREAGYRQGLAAAGIGFDRSLVRHGPHGAATAAELTAELLKSPDPPSAIFAASDVQAEGVLAAADRLGVSVPGQLSVIGFDDIESARLLGLSTVRQPLERSGAEAAGRLCALLRNEQVRPLRQQLRLQVVHRSSSGSPPGSTVRPVGSR